jgi:hypothetical protein
MTPHDLQQLLRTNPDLAAANGDQEVAPDDPFADFNDALYGPRADEPSEHDIQAAVFAWAAENEARLPELHWLYAIPNGGARHPAVGAKLKAEGVRRGYPDIGLDVARGCYHGLRIELKTRRGKPTPEQLAWLDRLHRQGYFCAVCYGVEQATETLTWYLGLEAHHDPA